MNLLFVLISFVNSNREIVFQCNFRKDFNWIVIGNAYTCDARIILGDSPFLTNVTGNHLEGYNNDDVLAFHIFTHRVFNR